MRILAGFFGGVFGILIGVVIALFAAIVITHNKPFGVIFIGMLMAPLGVVFGGILGALAGLQLLPHLRDQVSGRVRAKKFVVTLGLVISVTMMLIGLMVWTLRLGSVPPTDEKLLSNFDKHEATFNKLIDMIKTDSELIRVDEDWTNPEHPETIGVSPARIAAYRQMLREARVPRGFQSEAFKYEVDFFIGRSAPQSQAIQ
jgi:MFS family permease